MTAHVDTVPWARVPKRDDDALRRAQDLWLPAARQRGIVTPDGACLTSAGLSQGRLRVAPTAGTDRSRLADPSGGIEFLTRSPDGSRLCAISTEGGEHRVIDEAYPQADDEDDRRGLHDGRRVIGGTAGRRRLDGGIWLVATLLAVRPCRARTTCSPWSRCPWPAAPGHSTAAPHPAALPHDRRGPPRDARGGIRRTPTGGCVTHTATHEAASRPTVRAAPTSGQCPAQVTRGKPTRTWR
ncbi:hypothetical protein ACFCWG_36005 [Streptomyces sp. NPDC056390]|uniref:hypothetical protein n=1 Tax=Streptomyces sp. NPDC056390 TaxID=3345806 RepID=UPI0035E2CA81